MAFDVRPILWPMMLHGRRLDAWRSATGGGDRVAESAISISGIHLRGTRPLHLGTVAFQQARDTARALFFVQHDQGAFQSLMQTLRSSV
jgi:hypothetical protein